MSSAAAPGAVYLIGAGPGNPKLMTVAACEAIAIADVVLYDQLIPKTALANAKPQAKLVDVGKRGGGKQVPQATTEELMVKYALEGNTVARVKGGDPFVFGRGGEEAATLRQHGIPFVVVPGISSGIAGPAYAGIPVTHRDHAAAVALITGHENPDKPESKIDWKALAAFPGTLVFYMGVSRIPSIASSLIAQGRPQDQPVAIIQDATTSVQRRVEGTLATIAEVAQREQVKAPSIIVVGDVAALGSQLDWYQPGPLAGVSVAVTRARAQSSKLAERLEDLGAKVLQIPAIKTVSLNAQLPDLAPYDAILFTSPVGVSEFFAALSRSGADARSLAGKLIAAVGPGTARELAACGITADVVPTTFDGAALAEALKDHQLKRVLLPRAGETEGAKPSQALPNALAARGVQVDELELYQTVAEQIEPEQLKQLADCEYLTFTSASTVNYLVAAAGQVPDGPKLVSIGPLTSEALKVNAGRDADIEASQATIDGLIQALVQSC